MVISHFHPFLGGAEQQALFLSEQLIQKGYAVAVLTRSFPDLPSFESIRGIPVYRQIRTINRGKLFGLTYILSVLWFLFCRRSSYDIIHCHLLGFHSAIAVLFKWLFKKKTCSLVGATGVISDFSQIKNVFLGKLLLRLIARSDRLIVLCSQSRREARDEGIASAQLVNIPNGVDTGYFMPGSAIREKGNRIIFIGRLDYLKGVDILLQALRTLIDAQIPAQLDILGDGPDREKLTQLSNKLGPRDSIIFHGTVNGVAPYLQQASLFVLPSLSEGMPNVVLEAMACGLPVVATRVGGIVDIIENGKNGLLVDAQHPGQLYEAMKQVLTNKELAQQLGSAARKTIAERFSLPAIVDCYTTLYQEMMASR
jgi:glycosyltransferase involved in cell wall biosynthesis